MGVLVRKLVSFILSLCTFYSVMDIDFRVLLRVLS